MSVKWLGEGSGFYSNLLATYEYNGNPSVKVESIDVAIDVITATSHGFANGDIVFPSNINEQSVSIAYPGGITQQVYYIVNATVNSFQISVAKDGTPVDLTNNTNANQLTFQKALIKQLEIIIPESERVKVRFWGYASGDDKTYGWVVFPNTWNSSGDMSPNPLSSGNTSFGKVGAKGGSFYFDFDGSMNRRKADCSWAVLYGDNSFAQGTDPKIGVRMNDSYLGIPQNPKAFPFTGISIKTINSNIYIGNRTRIEVYRV